MWAGPGAQSSFFRRPPTGRSWPQAGGHGNASLKNGSTAPPTHAGCAYLSRAVHVMRSVDDITGKYEPPVLVATAGAWLFLGLAALAAVGDWWAVARDRKHVEYVCKPATLALLVGVAATLQADDNVVRACFIVALLLSLLGDVFLMLPHDLFIAG